MAWLTGWIYRKSVTLSRASGAVSNYQMRILVGESSDASGEDVDCGGLCLTTFDDLRFTKADGTTLLDYWIASITGTTPNQLATVWVEFDAIGTSDTTFYMYYGNADAVSASNGSDTFISFDDFEWGNDEDDIDTSGGSVTWIKTVDGTSTAKIDTSQFYSGSRSLQLHRGGTWDALASLDYTAGDNYAINFMFRKDADAYFLWRHGNSTNYLDFSVYTDEVIYSNYSSSGKSYTVGAWEQFEVNNINWTAKTFDLWHKGLNIKSCTMRTNPGWEQVDGKIHFGNHAGTTDLWIDNFFIRNWRSPEPAFGAWASQEAEFFPPIGFTLALYAPSTFPLFAPEIALNIITPSPFAFSFASVTDPISLLLGNIAPSPVSAFYPSHISLTFADINPAYYWEIPASQRPALQTIFTLTLTGGNESPALADLTLPMSSFQMRLQSDGNPNYLSAVVPNAVDYESDITDRQNGELVIRMGYKLQDGTIVLEEIGRAGFDMLRVDTGANSSSVTLSGYEEAPEYPSPKRWTLSDVSYRALYENGKRRLRAKIDMFLRPGDTVVYESDEYRVGELVYYINPTSGHMEVVEE